MNPGADQYRGAMLALAMGDALGAPHEGGPLERLVWRVIGSTRHGVRRFTDDTQMSLDLAESLLACGDLDQDDLAARFSCSYRWDRGYGPGTARVLKQIRSGQAWQEACRSVYPKGSFGNGGAMRAPVVGLFFFRCPERIIPAAKQSAEVTHAHPVGMEAASIIAGATAAALKASDGRGILESASNAASGSEFHDAFSLAHSWLDSGVKSSPKEVRSRLGMDITATRSCVTAVYLAARFVDAPFESLLRFAADSGGDVDTVGAMAGAIWGARNGFASLPAADVGRVEDADRIDNLAVQLYERSLTLSPSVMRPE